MKAKYSLLATLCGALALASAHAAEKKPNILVIFPDDVGWQNVSAYGHGTMGYNPFFPRLRSVPLALSGASRRKQIPCSPTSPRERACSLGYLEGAIW